MQRFSARFDLLLFRPGFLSAEFMVVVGTEARYLYRALLRFYRPDVLGKLTWWSRTAWTTRAAVLLIFFMNSILITITYAAGAAIALMRA
jgi:hypothetical protein